MTLSPFGKVLFVTSLFLLFNFSLGMKQGDKPSRRLPKPPDSRVGELFRTFHGGVPPGLPVSTSPVCASEMVSGDPLPPPGLPPVQLPHVLTLDQHVSSAPLIQLPHQAVVRTARQARGATATSTEVHAASTPPNQIHPWNIDYMNSAGSRVCPAYGPAIGVPFNFGDLPPQSGGASSSSDSPFPYGSSPINRPSPAFTPCLWSYPPIDATPSSSNPSSPTFVTVNGATFVGTPNALSNPSSNVRSFNVYNS